MLGMSYRNICRGDEKCLRVIEGRVGFCWGYGFYIICKSAFLKARKTNLWQILHLEEFRPKATWLIKRKHIWSKRIINLAAFLKHAFPKYIGLQHIILAITAEKCWSMTSPYPKSFNWFLFVFTTYFHIM